MLIFAALGLMYSTLDGVGNVCEKTFPTTTCWGKVKGKTNKIDEIWIFLVFLIPKPYVAILMWLHRRMSVGVN